MIDRIQTFIDSNFSISRVGLSRAVCGMFNWSDITGKLKDMSCRLALLKLERLGKLKLPPAHQFRNLKERPRLKINENVLLAQNPILSALNEIGKIELVRIDSSNTKDSRIWNNIMQNFHYLGAGPLCGAQIRYLIKDGTKRILGGFAFSAAAFSIADRDKWIGWDKYSRNENLHRIVCNSRFLILPYVKVPHLASHVLGQISKRIAIDWQERYGYKPLLLETYVDSERFKGTSYRASNWIHVGTTSGRSRQDREHKLQVSKKHIFLIELDKDARSLLCLSSNKNNTQPAAVKQIKEPQDWAEEEFGNADFNEQRLEQRLLIIARDFWAKPQANIPEACQSRAKTKAAYRFFEHEATTMDAILKPHYESTINRIRKEKIILAVQDTTELNYATHTATEGLGPVGTNKDGAVGLFVHDTLAITPEGTPLGLINVQCWARDKEEFGKRVRCHDLPIEEKESKKWLESFSAAREVQRLCPDTMVVSVGDRESDIYELFVAARDTGDNTKLLIRGRYDRPIADGHEHLWTALKMQAAPLITTVSIPRRGNRAARIATLEVRYKKVNILPPKRKPKLGIVTLWAIAAQEVNAPKEIEPIEWLLLTNMSIANDEDVLETLKWYSRRWGIEVYHRTLKSGCKIENRQLGRAERIEACLAIDMVIAWRIYYLTKMGRDTPDVPCTIFFEDFEWKALITHITKNKELPKTPPSLRDTVRMVASLGGFLGRKGDGEPGTKTTWLGLQYLDGLSIMFKYMAETYAPHLLCASVSVDPGYG